MEIKVVAIFGKAGSGKDFLLKKLIENNNEYNEVISYTSRPPRGGEVNGVNYHFITKQEFIEKINHKEFYEYTNFNGWFYGTGTGSFEKNKINIGVFNPEGVRSLLADSRLCVLPVYVSAADQVRLLRQLTREPDPNIDEIIRRYGADKEDFKGLDFSYQVVYNNQFNNDAYEEISTIIKTFQEK